MAKTSLTVAVAIIKPPRKPRSFAPPPRKKNDAPGGGPQGKLPGSMKCFECGSDEHLARDCEIRKARKGGGKGGKTATANLEPKAICTKCPLLSPPGAAWRAARRRFARSALPLRGRALVFVCV